MNHGTPTPTEPSQPADQLTFGFLDATAPDAAAPPIESARILAPNQETEGLLGKNTLAQADEPPDSAELEERCRIWLLALDLPGAAKLVRVEWNARLRSTAGYASYPAWRIELNPRLTEFAGQVERTLKHELAHLIAYHRAGRRRIDAHGPEWRQACAVLGIADEKACHHLPLPRHRQRRSLAYKCPACGFILHRVRRFRRPTACLSCCNAHNRGLFDARFRLQALPPPLPETPGAE